MDFQKIARQLVVDHFNFDKMLDTPKITIDDTYVVWFCKTLQNWKALVSTTVEDGRYYEVTSDGDKKQIYLDTYIKLDNQTYIAPI